jgi:hypothetical protein
MIMRGQCSSRDETWSVQKGVRCVEHYPSSSAVVFEKPKLTAGQSTTPSVFLREWYKWLWLYARSEKKVHKARRALCGQDGGSLLPDASALYADAAVFFRVSLLPIQNAKWRSIRRFINARHYMRHKASLNPLPLRLMLTFPSHSLDISLGSTEKGHFE